MVVEQVIAHLVGDYLLQSDWMANEKTKKIFPALAHALFYTIPFLYITFSWKALLAIAVSHFVIDHFRIARQVCWVKNFIAPKSYWYAWEDCNTTGYHKDRPPWLAVWLLIIADNTIHLICNGIIIKFL